MDEHHEFADLLNLPSVFSADVQLLSISATVPKSTSFDFSDRGLLQQTVYVDPTWPNPVPGQNPGVPAPSSVVYGVNAFSTIADAP